MNSCALLLKERKWNLVILPSLQVPQAQMAFIGLVNVRLISPVLTGDAANPMDR